MTADARDAAESPAAEDRALRHLIEQSDPGIKGLVLDLLRASDGDFSKAPLAIRRVMEDLLLGLRLGGANDSEIESRFGLGRGDLYYFERAVVSRSQRGDGRLGRWQRWPSSADRDRNGDGQADVRDSADGAAERNGYS